MVGGGGSDMLLRMNEPSSMRNIRTIKGSGCIVQKKDVKLSWNIVGIAILCLIHGVKHSLQRF